MRYRPEIDGLRAVAVLAVIFFHAGFPLFGGGFVGVDIFFVISGYLITSIIYPEIQAGNFSFTNFYARRVGRIIPPLFLVMLLCIPFACFYLLPTHLKEFGRSLIYIPLFVSNIFFMRQSGYFDSDVDIKPMIHSWSLAVEEQYYLIFPALLYLIYKFNKQLLLPILSLLALASFLLIIFPHFDSPATYFLLPTRAWELLLGVFLAIYSEKFTFDENYNKRIGPYLSLIGLVFIAYSVFFIDRNQPFPSFITLLPTTGTALIIYSSYEKNYVNRFLSSKCLVGIGLISYSLYLWHQPIFAFTRYIKFSEPSPLIFIFLITITFVFAYLSWRFVEKPFRRMVLKNREFIFTFYLILSLLFVLFGLWVEKEKGFVARFPELRDLRVLPVSCHNPKNGVCVFNGASNKLPTFAVFGDSHALAMMPMFSKIADTNQYSYAYSARHSCPPLLNVHNLKESDTDDGCFQENNDRLDFIASHPSIKKVFFIARWSVYTDGNYEGNNIQFLGLMKDDLHNKETSRQAFESSLVQTVDAYKKLGVKVYFVKQVPLQNLNVSQYCYFIKRKTMVKEEIDQLIYSKSISHNMHQRLQAFSSGKIDAMRERNAVETVNLDDLFCDGRICRMARGPEAYYYDKDHLSPLGANLTSSVFTRAIDE